MSGKRGLEREIFSGEIIRFPADDMATLSRYTKTVRCREGYIDETAKNSKFRDSNLGGNVDLAGD
jgi:hypothetical protein